MEKLTNPASVRPCAPQTAPYPSAADAGPGAPRAPYAPPVLERLGAWRALTLQQSVPIFP